MTDIVHVHHLKTVLKSIYLLTALASIALFIICLFARLQWKQTANKQSESGGGSWERHSSGERRGGAVCSGGGKKKKSL